MQHKPSLINLALLFSGRGSNMRAIAQACKSGVLQHVARIACTCSNQTQAAGLNYSKNQGLPSLCIPSKGVEREEFEQRLIEELVPYNIDLVILAGFKRILSPYFLQHYPDRVLNIHPADTALFQGLHAYQWAFESQRTETSVTVHLVDEGVDTGRVLGKKSFSIEDLNSLAEVEKKGLAIEHQLYSKVIAEYCKQIRQTSNIE